MARSESVLLEKYERLYRENPKSKVFVPLAEAMRKLGRVDEAISLLKKGIRKHPSFLSAYVGLASCFQDKENFELVYSTLLAHVQQNRDNLRLQKLFAEACYQLGNDDDALATFKGILFINPLDREVSARISEIENRRDYAISDGGVPEARDIFSETDLDDWAIVSHQDGEGTQDDLFLELEKESENVFDFGSEIDEWQAIGVESSPARPNPKKLASSSTTPPVMTHTLVDLYCAQGHVDKAVDILEKILELHPGDERSRERLEELRVQKTQEEKEYFYSPEVLEEDLGRAGLMESFERVSKETRKEGREEGQGESEEEDEWESVVINQLSTFLLRIKDRAKEVKAVLE